MVCKPVRLVLLYKKSNGRKVYVILNVDDKLVFAKTSNDTEAVEAELKSAFPAKVQGGIGNRMRPFKKVLYIRQKSLIKNYLKGLHLSEANPVSTPLIAGYITHLRISRKPHLKTPVKTRKN